MTSGLPTPNKLFTESESRILEEVMLHRRDVRGDRFVDAPLPDEILQRILDAALHAPSVGFSQPWQFVVIRDPRVKQGIKANFDRGNDQAQHAFDDERQAMYQRLKLEGIVEAPVNLAVFYAPSSAPVLGQTSIDEVGLFSVVCAVQNMWLMARSLNVGMGWVSILDPDDVKATLSAPDDFCLVAYLCLGYVEHFDTQPQLEKLGWEQRKHKNVLIHCDRFGVAVSAPMPVIDRRTVRQKGFHPAGLNLAVPAITSSRFGEWTVPGMRIG